MAARSRPRWLLRFGLLIGSLLFVLLCTEAVIRILIYQRANAVAAESVNPAPELPVLNGMFELGRKNVRGTHKGVLSRKHWVLPPCFLRPLSFAYAHILLCGAVCSL